MTPKAVLEVTVRDQGGTQIFTNRKQYTVNDLYFKGGKQVAMAEWDVTATEHFDMGLKALETDSRNFLIPLALDTESVTVETGITYLYSRDKSFILDKLVREIVIEQNQK